MQNKNTNAIATPGSLAKQGGKKILFACVPADGHFNPLTGIAKHLQSLGYDVRWYSSVTYAEKLKKIEIPFYPFKKALDVTGDKIDEMFPERQGINNEIKKLNFDLQHVFILRSTEYLADIQEIYESFQFDLMISDCVFTAIPFVKEIMNIPVIAIGVLPLFETSKDLAPSGLAMTPATNLAGRVKHSILRFLSKKLLFKKSDDLMHTLLKAHGINMENTFLFDIMIKTSNLLLQSGTPGFEYHRSDLSSNVRFIGALLPYSSNNKRAPWFDERLNRYGKVVLVTQGTVERNPEKIIVPVLEAYKNMDTLVVATTGGSQTKQLRERYPQENIIIEDFIPFGDIMPYADVYVTNGGYGGVMLGIENKLPLVVAGVHEGKNEINARIGYFELGVNLKTETPTPEAIKKAIDEVLNNEGYKKNVEALAGEFKEYDTYQLCAGYVKELFEPSITHLRLVTRNGVHIKPSLN